MLAAQSVAVLSARWTADTPMAAAPALGLLGLSTLSNLALDRVRHRVGPQVVGPVLLLDTALLTLLLHLTGGPLNPFTVLYLVHITQAAMLLGPRWVAPLTALSLLGYGTLFAVRPVDAPHHAMAGHLRGMWLAFAIASCLIAVFVSRLTSVLARREAELRAAHRRTDRSRRVAALTSLAASAAHELGSPVGTIALAAGELEEVLTAEGASGEAVEDARLIRAEARRCRAILDGLAARAGHAPGESLSTVTPRQLATLAHRRLPAADQGRVRVRVDDDERTSVVPREALLLAIGNLLRNALEATPTGETVDLDVVTSASDLTVAVRDRGVGMEPELLGRAADAFVTTKRGGEGAGLGLGLFLVRALADQLGGRLELRSTAGEGTLARLTVPRTPQAESS